MKTTVTARGQTVIPAKIRKEHQIEISTKLEIEVRPLYIYIFTTL